MSIYDQGHEQWTPALVKNEDLRELLVPYTNLIQQNSDALLKALIARANHVLTVRKAVSPSEKNWKNKLPLEWATEDGFLLKTLRLCADKHAECVQWDVKSANHAFETGEHHAFEAERAACRVADTQAWNRFGSMYPESSGTPKRFDDYEDTIQKQVALLMMFGDSIAEA